MAYVVLIGAGPVGLDAANALVADGVADELRLVVDPDEGARRDSETRLGVATLPSTEELAPAESAAWAVLAFSSSADQVGPVAARLLDQGYDVVTTCEELSDPVSMWRATLHERAKAAGRTAIATGANPGFVMDRLVVTLAGASRNITEIRVSRRVDTATRRGPLVAKSGKGLTAQEFADRAARGEVGHVGLAISAKLVAQSLGWDIVGVEEDLQPVIGPDGRVWGQQQHADVTCAGRRLSYDLRMAWEVEDPGDAIEISGEPPVSAVIPGGYHGDTGTTAAVVNAVRRAPAMRPGFYLPTEVPLAVGAI